MEHNTDLTSMDSIFDNKTFQYRINGFFHACKMEDIDVIKNTKILFKEKDGSNNYNKDSSETTYFISLNKDDKEKNKSITLSGQYNDLHFVFTNYYKNERKLNHKIVDLPFMISLEKIVDNDTYKFDIETIEGIRTKFSIMKFREFKDHTLRNNVVFYANVTDFSKILKMVKTFVYNPQLVFTTYNNLMQEEKIVFSNRKLDKMAMQDDTLDKPIGKVGKVLKKIMDPK